ncbi:MAG: phage major capsid protein [Reyranella sp.]
MKLSTALREKRADLLDRLEKLSNTAANENRLMDATESAAWDAGQKELRDLDANLGRQLQAEDLRRGGNGGPRALVDPDGRRHPLLWAKDRLADRYRAAGGDPLPLAGIVRAMVTGRADSPAVERALATTPLTSGGYAVPAELSAEYLDLARAASVCIQAGAGTLEMASSTLRIARIDADPEPAFKAENAAFPISDMIFGGLDLTARTIGVVVKSSMELLADSELANQMLVQSLTAQMGLAMDIALLQGTGVAPNPTGILVNAGIGDVPVGGALADYDAYLDAMALVEGANLTPKSVINHPANVNTLRKLATGLAGDITKAPPPPDYLALQRLMTTSMPAANALVGDFQWAALALREGITIEASRVAGDATGSAMVNGQVWVRAYARMDSAVLRPKAFAKLSGIA